MQFRTHTGEIVSGDRLTQALNQVADEWAQIGIIGLTSNDWPAHVTEDIKQEFHERHIKHAEEIRVGEVNSFTIWQRVNTVLTGECVALLPK